MSAEQQNSSGAKRQSRRAATEPSANRRVWLLPFFYAARPHLGACSALAALTILSLAATTHAAARIEAYRGEPFGVGRVTIDLPPDPSTSPGSDDRFAVADAEGRVLYPVVQHRDVGRIVRRFINIQLPNRATFYFLFRGDEPLRLTVHAPSPQQFTILPEQDHEEFHELMQDWWKATSRRYERAARDAEYPIVVENYLTANWARRLGREAPEPGLALLGQRKIGGSWVTQLTAGEAYQARLERDLVLGRFGDGQTATLPLPEVVGAPSGERESTVSGPELPAPVEPLAAHVPQECFYLRFGSFPNYLWYRDFTRHWQNDLGNMVVLRSIHRSTRDRIQAQLAIGESEVARVMGPQVIRDVAFIGLDYYLRDGAAFGILFQANNSFLLGRNFNRQRDEAVKKHPQAKLETITIVGRDVSYLHTPDGKLRSYYAVDGDFHLITTSRRLVERFFEVGADDGADSLAALAEFQNARADMPLERDDMLFLYLSTAFFENLTSPAYRVELDRRLRSIGEMRVLEVARMAARAEGWEAESVDELIRGEFLPPGFGERADGSRLIAEEGGYRDSLRGIPGWFLPIADRPVERVTPAEAQHYAAFTRSIEAEVGRFVPVVAGIQRRTSDDGDRDHIDIDLRVAPYSATRMVGWAHMLGPAETLRVAPIGGDVASLEVVADALGQSVHVFGGLRDFRTPLVVRQGEARPAGAPDEYLRGYFGTWPRPLALIRTFIGRPVGPPDAEGVVRNRAPLGLWQRRVDDFFLFALQRDVLMEVGPQLAMVDAPRPAQIRLWIDDLSDKEIATGVSGLGYMRTRKASASASRFMNSLTAQLHVPPAEAREVAERLVGGRFVDPLGGEYELLEAGARMPARGDDDELLPAPDARRLWASTATAPQNRFLLTEIPADYQMPLMDWFRGLELEIARNDAADALTLHAELDMVHLDVSPPAEPDQGGNFFSNLLGRWGGEDSHQTPPSSEQGAHSSDSR